MTTDHPAQQRVERVVTALRSLFAARPAGLLTDVDGTISRITAHTNAATVDDTVRASLTALAGELDVVSVVTGRAVVKAQAMVGVESIGYVGNHGLEWLQDGVVQTDAASLAVRPALEAALTAVRSAISDPGLVYEDKNVSASIHYRLAANPDAAGRHLHDVLAPHLEDGQLRLIQGGFVVNLLPGLKIDKGEATRRLVQQHGLRSVAFFGDDVTDVDAFRAIRELEAAGLVRGLAIGVLSPEGPPAVREQADLLLDGVGEVEAVLAALAADPPTRPAPGA